MSIRSQPLQSTKNFIIGNNDMAVAAADHEAKQLGYSTYTSCAAQPEGPVENIGRHLADTELLRHMAETNCHIYGGEGIVKLAPPAERGLGGRNQQTVLAALIELTKQAKDKKWPEQIVILSGGTDGEDGPTDAAGAFVDSAISKRPAAADSTPKITSPQRRLPLFRAARHHHQDRADEYECL